MDRQQLEKLIDNKSFTETIGLYDDREERVSKEDIKQFIFDTVILEVIKDIQKEFGHYHNVNDCLDINLKKRAKDLYGITL